MTDRGLDVVDCHHHLWNLNENYYPWLTDHISTRVCGDYRKIRRDYSIGDYFQDAKDVNLVKSVHVQAEHDHTDPVRETRWLQSVADGSSSQGFPHAIVAFADFRQDNVEDVLAAHCEFRNVRGIRQMLHESMLDAHNNNEDLLSDSRWRRNFASIEQFALSFDLQVYYPQAPAAYALARDHPDVQFIICHMGQPADRSPAALAGWKQSLQGFAELPNTMIKISGVGMFDRTWTRDSLRPIVLTVIDVFGPARCMFGSNFPVDGMMSSYQRLWQAFVSLVGGFSVPEQQQMLAANAERAYRI